MEAFPLSPPELEGWEQTVGIIIKQLSGATCRPLYRL
jgi:hypothetical protein